MIKLFSEFENYRIIIINMLEIGVPFGNLNFIKNNKTNVVTNIISYKLSS